MEVFHSTYYKVLSKLMMLSADPWTFCTQSKRTTTEPCPYAKYRLNGISAVGFLHGLFDVPQKEEKMVPYLYHGITVGSFQVLQKTLLLLLHQTGKPWFHSLQILSSGVITSHKLRPLT